MPEFQNIESIIAIISSLVALAVSIFSIFKVFIVEKQLRKRKINNFRDKTVEQTVENLGELIEEFQTLRHLFKRIHEPVDGFKREEAKKHIKKSYEKIEKVFSKLVSLGVLNGKCEETMKIYEEVHKSKNYATQACFETTRAIDSEKVTNVIDCSKKCAKLASKFYTSLRQEQFSISGAQTQLIAKYGTVI